MKPTTIRIYVLDKAGRAEDVRLDYGLGDFAGMLPDIGDEILAPVVEANFDRREPKHRRFWKVERRIFNPRDMADYVVLVVREGIGTDDDRDLIG